MKKYTPCTPEEAFSALKDGWKQVEAVGAINVTRFSTIATLFLNEGNLYIVEEGSEETLEEIISEWSKGGYDDISFRAMLNRFTQAVIREAKKVIYSPHDRAHEYRGLSSPTPKEEAE